MKAPFTLGDDVWSHLDETLLSDLGTYSALQTQKSGGSGTILKVSFRGGQFYATISNGVETREAFGPTMAIALCSLRELRSRESEGIE
jgi:hypothetical protein